MKSRTRGFTIVELLIVILVIGILAAIVIVGYGAVTKNAIDKSILSDADAIDGLETNIGVKNNSGGIAWYSGPSGTNGAPDSTLGFKPSNGNVIDVSVDSTDYCIRIYNKSAATYSTLATAYQKGSTNWSCNSIRASSAALADFAPSSPTYVWTKQTGAGVQNWSVLASSSDGQKVVSAGNGGYLETSTNGGVTWTQQTALGTPDYWQGLASSSDGTKLYAISTSWSTGITSFSSSMNSGGSWSSQTAPCAGNNGKVATSSDGTKVAVECEYPASIASSTNSGASWTILPVNTANNNVYWDSIVMSADGTKIALGGEDDYIYTSSDSGVTWTQRSPYGPSTIGEWEGLAMSSDGTKLIAGDYYGGGGNGNGGYVYTSSDSGATWTQQTSLGVAFWTGTVISTSGSVMVAMTNGPNGLYPYSRDGGTTWQWGVAPIPNMTLSGPALPNNGQQLYMMGSTSYSDPNSYIYTANYQ